MANATCLAAARDSVLERAGWDVARDGLIGAPPMTVVAGAEAHATIFTALRLIGLGRDAARLVAVDDQGAMDPDALARELETRPAIVCAQAGNVNTGAFDPLEPIADACERPARGCTSTARSGCGRRRRPAHRHLTRGVERADSWATDAHKWLNVPYDSGLAIVARPRGAPRRDGRHRRLPGRRRAPRQLRLHARGLAPRARLPALRRAALARPPRAGRAGRAQLRAGARGSRRLLREGGAEILNDVVLNQVLVAAPPERRRARPGRRHVLGRRHGLARPPAMRISVSGWATTDDDVERSAAAILAAL